MGPDIGFWSLHMGLSAVLGCPHVGLTVGLGVGVILCGSDCRSGCLCGAGGRFGGRGDPIWVRLWGFGVGIWV